MEKAQLIPMGHIIENRELPKAFPPLATGMRTVRYLSRLLPLQIGTGYDLKEVDTGPSGDDPVILTDRWGHILYEWPEGFTPKEVDVLRVCQGLKII